MFKKFLKGRFRKGFTLTELLIVMAIIIILAVILIGVIDPVALVGKANDAERKRDLDLIKKGFEEYYNDNDKYPITVSSWNIEDNCNRNLTENFKYLYPWPCDPDGSPYYIIVDDDGSWFKVLTNLEYESDKVIPDGWYSESAYTIEGFTYEEVNYGVSSSNVSWKDLILNDNCSESRCNIFENGRCNSAGGECSEGQDCYRHDDCISECKVSCCGTGCN